MEGADANAGLDAAGAARLGIDALDAHAPTGNGHLAVGGVVTHSVADDAAAQRLADDHRRQGRLRGRAELVGAAAARYSRDRRRSFRESRVPAKLRTMYADYEDRAGVHSNARPGVARWRAEGDGERGPSRG